MFFSGVSLYGSGLRIISFEVGQEGEVCSGDLLLDVLFRDVDINFER